MRVAIIGAGLQMRRRVGAILQSPDDKVVIIVGMPGEKQPAEVKQLGCEWGTSWADAVSRSDVDAVLVCTPPHVHAEISIAAMRAGKHVLCEKPLSRTMQEGAAMIAVSRETKKMLKCGFNHRHHPAMLEARKRFERGDIGKVLNIRCRYGICGRPGYEKEWRADPAQAAGGQFLEQGSHAIDLFRWFMGDLVDVSCMTSIAYFKTQNMDDNGMALFRSADGGLAMLHASLTQWKNLFSFEILGEDGYLVVDGLGTSYGVERLYAGKRDFTAPFQDVVTEYRSGDNSWLMEWREFKAAIAEEREPLGSGTDGLEAMRASLASYEAEKTRSVISIPSYTG